VQVGTTVTLTRIFERLPVRAAELRRNIKREFARVVALVNQYAIVCHETRMSLVNVPSKTKVYGTPWAGPSSQRMRTGGRSRSRPRAAADWPAR
jgi:DNA mismatch repair ATPase MutL